MSVQDYINTYCTLGSQKKGSCVPIVNISNFPLQVLVSTIVRVAGYSSLHLATRNQMRIGVECLQGTVFDCCSGIIPIMKKQLSDCKRGRRNNFGYSSVLVAFFFERVPAISLAVPLPEFSPRQPRLNRWGEIFLLQGSSGSVQSVYDDDFYLWWGWQLPALEQFPYASLDFRGDTDLVLPPGGVWGMLGILLFKFFKFLWILIIKIYT